MVPFRDSKLTRLFQDYFVGNGKASMIVNVSPCSSDYEETCHVLKFSAIAKEITVSIKPDTRAQSRQGLVSSSDILDSFGDINNDDNIEIENKVVKDKEELENLHIHLENSIRNEVSKEMELTISQMELQFKKRLLQEVIYLIN